MNCPNQFYRLLLTPLSVCAFWLQATAAEVTVTPWGDPDLQGTWDRRTITPLQRPEQFSDQAYLDEQQVAAYEQRGREREDGRPPDDPLSGISVHAPEDLDYGNTVLSTRQTSLIVDPADGRIPPLTEEGARRRAELRATRSDRGSADSWTDRTLFERCITRGIPEGMLPGPYNNNIQILQTPDVVLVLNEMIHEARIIPVNSQPHLSESIGQWLGDSRGHWEGDTLVVETTNFSGRAPFRGSTEHLSLMERFTRTDAQTLLYEFTVSDPQTWTHPWTVSFPMVLSDEPIYEYACHEGNYALRNILSTARYLESQEENPQ